MSSILLGQRVGWASWLFRKPSWKLCWCNSAWALSRIVNSPLHLQKSFGGTTTKIISKKKTSPDKSFHCMTCLAFFINLVSEMWFIKKWNQISYFPLQGWNFTKILLNVLMTWWWYSVRNKQWKCPLSYILRVLDMFWGLFFKAHFNNSVASLDSLYLKINS